MQVIQSILLIGCGGAAGAVARALVGEAASRAFGPGFPAGTLLVNAVGSFAMGVLAVVLLERAADPRLFAFSPPDCSADSRRFRRFPSMRRC